MLESKVYEAKTEEEAIEKALNELNLTKDDIFYKTEFVEGKLFKSSKNIVTVLNKNDIKEYINSYFKTIGEYMNLNIETEINITDKTFSVMLVSDNNAVLIGKNGKILNALQALIRQSIRNKIGLAIKLNLDISNYKVKKMKNIERLVKGIAEDVEASGISVSLDPMNSFERRLVHTLIDEYPNLTTESTGEGRERHVTIKYVGEEKES